MVVVLDFLLLVVVVVVQGRVTRPPFSVVVVTVSVVKGFVVVELFLLDEDVVRNVEVFWDVDAEVLVFVSDKVVSDALVLVCVSEADVVVAFSVVVVVLSVVGDSDGSFPTLVWHAVNVNSKTTANKATPVLLI